MNDAYEALIRSSHRVSAETRLVLLERAHPDDPHYVPRAMDEQAFATLRALVARLLPQSGAVWIDLAARIDKQLSQNSGDGWRHALLPPDGEAYRAALHTLRTWALAEFARPFSELSPEMQDGFLGRMAEGDFPRLGDGSSLARPLEPDQMKAWFDDLRADAVRVYMAHPETLSRIGYSGIANGGDGRPKSGFARIGIDERESWEPVVVTAQR